jgi:hypothetical protein
MNTSRTILRTPAAHSNPSGQRTDCLDPAGFVNCYFNGRTLANGSTVFSSSIAIYQKEDPRNLSSPPLNITPNDGGSVVIVGNKTTLTSTTRSYLFDKTVCTPSTVYRWGFSSQILFAFCMATFIFLIILQVLAWNLYEHSRIYRLEQRINVYRDVLDISRELSTIYGPGLSDMSPNEVQTDLQRQNLAMEMQLNDLPEIRHSERENLDLGRGEEVHGAFSFDISPKWYRRIAKLLNSHWATEDVIVYWPAKREAVRTGQLPLDDRERLVAESETGTLRSTSTSVHPATGESIALRSLASQNSEELDEPHAAQESL